MLRMVIGAIIAAHCGLAFAETPAALTDENFNWIPDALESSIVARGGRPDIDTALLNYASAIAISHKNILEGFTEKEDTSLIIRKARSCLNPVIGEDYPTRFAVTQIMRDALSPKETLNKALLESENINLTYATSTDYCNEFIAYRDKLRFSEFPETFQPDAKPVKNWWSPWKK